MSALCISLGKQCGYKECGNLILSIMYTTIKIITNQITVDTFRFRFMLFNATFNTISVISWKSVVLMKETGAPGDNHRPVVSHPEITTDLS